MRVDPDTLPDDPALLKAMLLSLNTAHNTISNEYSQLEKKYSHLETENDSLRQKLTEEEMHQLFLFNEAEDGVNEKALEELKKEQITVPSYTRKKRGRNKISDDIPREEIIYDLDKEEKQCPCCGKDRPEIGEEATEELDIIPQRIVVKKHIKKKYGLCKCDDFLGEEIPEIKTAKAPSRFIPGSMATPGLIAYSVTSKFCDALPFYRQAHICPIRC